MKFIIVKILILVIFQSCSTSRIERNISSLNQKSCVNSFSNLMDLFISKENLFAPKIYFRKEIE